MNYRDEIIEFSIKGFEQTEKELVTNGIHRHVLKNKLDNFFGPKPNFKFHRWAGSLKSSQAFAYNVFSGVNNHTLKFEFPMEVFKRDAQIDVMIEDLKSQTIELFEVKAFEITQLGKNKIAFKDKYFDKTQYKSSDISDPFIEFLNTVINRFKNQKVYGGGVKQLCSHLLGVINTMNKPEYICKKFKLYSFCYDNSFSNKFERDIKNYKETVTIFKTLVDEFLKDMKMDSRVEYCGFLSASEYVNKNKKLLGQKNYNYLMKRYF